MSPDGKSVAVSKMDPATENWNLWIYEIDRNSPIRLTNHQGNDARPIWSPDGKWVVFGSWRGSGSYGNLWLKEVASLQPEKPLLETAEPKFPTSWSIDGKNLLFYRFSAETRTDLMTVRMDVESPSAEIFLDSDRWEHLGRFSPDGKWIAYRSDELRTDEIFAISFPEKRERVRISISGGDQPVWSPDGTKLYYRDPEAFIVEVETKFEGSRLIPGAPKRLFQISSGHSIESFDITPDGKRFLVNAVEKPTNVASLKVVLNWPTELQKK